MSHAQDNSIVTIVLVMLPLQLIESSGSLGQLLQQTADAVDSIRAAAEAMEAAKQELEALLKGQQTVATGIQRALQQQAQIAAAPYIQSLEVISKKMQFCLLPAPLPTADSLPAEVSSFVDKMLDMCVKQMAFKSAT